MNKKSKKNSKTMNGEIPEETLIKFHDTFDRLVSGDSTSESGVRSPRQNNLLDEDEEDYYDEYDDEYDEEYDEYDYNLQALDQGSEDEEAQRGGGGDQV